MEELKLNKEDILNISKWITATSIMIEAKLRTDFSQSERDTWEKIQQMEHSMEKYNMKERRYDQWAGNERGISENKTRCIAEVTDETGWHRYQCDRKRGYGPNGEYCKQHAKIAERDSRDLGPGFKEE